MEDVEQVQEWIEVGEYGLAYERLCDVLEDVHTDDRRVSALNDAGELMGFPK